MCMWRDVGGYLDAARTDATQKEILKTQIGKWIFKVKSRLSGSF